MSVLRHDERPAAGMDDIRLDGVDVDVLVGDGLVGFDEELTIDGSPIVRLSVLDPERTLTGSGLLRLDGDDSDRLVREVELIVDRTAYWLRQVAKRDDIFELTFEDRTVCKLRDRVGAATKVAGGTLGHRDLVTRLCGQADVPAPVMRDPGPRELAAHQKVGKTALAVAAARQARDEKREPGLPDRPLPGLRVKGAQATAAQLQVASRLLTVAHDLGAGPKATLALVLAGIVESVLSNPATPSADGYGSYGVLQARVGVSRGANGTVATIAEALDVEYMAESFLVDRPGYGFTSKGGAMYLERTQPSMTPGEIAQAVEGSAYPHRYAEHEAEGRAIVAAFHGGKLPSGLGYGGVRETPLTVQRGESCWEAILRIADDYAFRFFVVANTPFYLADEALMASRPRAVLSEDAPGVDWIDWEWAPRKPLRRVDLQCRAHSWQIPLGSVVLLDDSCGLAGASDDNANHGRWLVADYERSRFEPTARVTLIKGRRPRVPTETISPTRGGDGDGTVPVGRGGSTSPFGGVRTFPITSPYGWRESPPRFHRGVDVGTPHGTPCIAPFDGRITLATTSGFAGGGMIHIEALAAVPGTTLKAGDKLGWGHVSQASVPEGRRVAAGTVVGRTGTSDNGEPHCHFVYLRTGAGGNGVDGNTDAAPVLRALGGVA